MDFGTKKNPFKGDFYNSKFEVNKKIVVITRATLRWNRLLSFWNAVPRASKAIKNAKGVSIIRVLVNGLSFNKPQ